MDEVRVGQSRVGAGVYVGLFFTTLSTLMYEILLTRIFSVTMWYHFAFVAVSVALFGMTVGALIVHLSPGRFPQERTKERIAQASVLFSIAIILSFLTQLSIPFDPRWSLTSVFSVVLLYAVISVPFVFSGVAVCLVLTRFPARVSTLYAVDLVGAGLGTVTLIWVLDLLEDGPSAVLAVAALAGVGGLFFAAEAGQRRMSALAAVATCVFAALAAGNAIAADHHNPIVYVRWVKGDAEGVPLYEKWNAISRITVHGDPAERTAPIGWGMSGTYRPQEGVGQLLMFVDAAAGTVLTEYDGSRESIEFLRYDVTNVVHYIRPNANVFIVGSGGGRDVLSALYFDQPSVTAVEINDEILDIVNGRFGEFTGHLDRRPGVTFVSDEARSYLARSKASFDIIQVSLIDTWAATAAGAFALSENSVYTTDAWQTFLEHLTPRGVLSVSRWYLRDRPLEAYRLTSLAAESLRGVGIARPSEHLMLVASQADDAGTAVGTILVSREPFTPSDIAEIERVADELEFEVVLAPDHAGSDPMLGRIAEADDPARLDVGFSGDISAPTDDRPFFFQMIRFQDVFDPSIYGGLHGSVVTKSVLVLFSLAVAVLGLTALCIILPLFLTTSREMLRGMLPLVVFFCGIGLGFLLLEIAQMQRLIIFLGHPTYALSVVLFSLLVFSGLGSLATERLVNPRPNPRLSPSLLLPLAVLLPVLVVLGFLTPAVIDHFEAETNPVRITAAVAVLAPMGLLMGMPFPLGMKVASLKPDAPTAFFWGINGATSVCASVFAVVISMGWGISSAFWAGCLSYAAASAALGLVVLRGRV